MIRTDNATMVWDPVALTLKATLEVGFEWSFVTTYATPERPCLLTGVRVEKELGSNNDALLVVAAGWRDMNRFALAFVHGPDWNMLAVPYKIADGEEIRVSLSIDHLFPWHGKKAKIHATLTLAEL